jgi:hypothetical protein
VKRGIRYGIDNDTTLRKPEEQTGSAHLLLRRYKDEMCGGDVQGSSCNKKHPTRVSTFVIIFATKKNL